MLGSNIGLPPRGERPKMLVVVTNPPLCVFENLVAVTPMFSHATPLRVSRRKVVLCPELDELVFITQCDSTHDSIPFTTVSMGALYGACFSFQVCCPVVFEESVAGGVRFHWLFPANFAGGPSFKTSSKSRVIR